MMIFIIMVIFTHRLSVEFGRESQVFLHFLTNMEQNYALSR